MNIDLANVYNWLLANKLDSNPAKSTYIIVAPKMNAKPTLINNTEMPYFNNVKHLGVHIDLLLNFQAHIKSH